MEVNILKVILRINMKIREIGNIIRDIYRRLGEVDCPDIEETTFAPNSIEAKLWKECNEKVTALEANIGTAIENNTVRGKLQQSLKVSEKMQKEEQNKQQKVVTEIKEREER